MQKLHTRPAKGTDAIFLAAANRSRWMMGHHGRRKPSADVGEGESQPAFGKELIENHSKWSVQ